MQEAIPAEDRVHLRTAAELLITQPSMETTIEALRAIRGDGDGSRTWARLQYVTNHIQRIRDMHRRMQSMTEGT